MASVKTSGTQLAVLTTEHDLATVTDAGTYQLVVDASDLVNDETLTLRIYGKARTADTERLLYENNFKHILPQPLLASLAVVSPHFARFTLEQNGGPGRRSSESCRPGRTEWSPDQPELPAKGRRPV